MTVKRPRARSGRDRLGPASLSSFDVDHRCASPLSQRPVTPEVAGSSPVAPVLKILQIGTLSCLARRGTAFRPHIRMLRTAPNGKKWPESLSAVTISSGVRVLAALANEVGRRPHETTGGQGAHSVRHPSGRLTATLPSERLLLMGHSRCLARRRTHPLPVGQGFTAREGRSPPRTTGLSAGTNDPLRPPEPTRATRPEAELASGRGRDYFVPMPMLTALLRTARPFAPARSRSVSSRIWRSRARLLSLRSAITTPEIGLLYSIQSQSS